MKSVAAIVCLALALTAASASAKLAHPAPSSEVTMSNPKTSLWPSQLTAVAITQQVLRIRPPSRHFITMASSHI